MQLKSIVVAATALANSANAFLLPLSTESEHTSKGKNTVNALPISVEDGSLVPGIAASRAVKIGCPGCPVLFPGTTEATTDVPSDLELDFSIDHAAGNDRLLVNGFELYPKSDPLAQTLKAAVVPHMTTNRVKHHNKHQKAPLQVLGFGLRSGTVPSSDDDDNELIAVDFQVIEVGNVFLNGLPNVQIRLIKTPGNALLIAGIDIKSSDTPTESEEEECTTLFCNWKAMIMAHINRFRMRQHCKSHHHHEAVPAADSEAPEDLEVDGNHDNQHLDQDMNGASDPEFGGHTIVEDGSGHRANLLHLLRSIASHVLLPIAIGIMAGVTASVLGMVVGTFAICMWRTFIRPARRQGSHKPVLGETAYADEKAGLMVSVEEHQEASPPAYPADGHVEFKKTETGA